VKNGNILPGVPEAKPSSLLKKMTISIWSFRKVKTLKEAQVWMAWDA
jgi:hypothetical protein